MGSSTWEEDQGITGNRMKSVLMKFPSSQWKRNIEKETPNLLFTQLSVQSELFMIQCE